MAVSEDHKRLCAVGVKWLKSNGFGVVASGIGASHSKEIPDVIGFRESASALIEVKVSRADFLVDKKKAFRSFGGLGLYRFYLCPEGMIKPEELPSGWGLLYENGKKVRDIVRPKGNIWPAFDWSDGEWDRFKHQINVLAERSVLYSISRRLVKGETLHRG